MNRLYEVQTQKDSQTFTLIGLAFTMPFEFSDLENDPKKKKPNWMSSLNGEKV